MPVNYITNAPNKSIAYLPVDNRYKEDNDFSLALVGIISAKNRGFELVPDIATQLKKLRKKDDPNVKIIILGDGPFKEEFEKKVKTSKHEDIIKILGFFPYEQAMSISKSCDIGIIIVPAISIHNIYSGPNRLYECLGNYQPFITSDVYEFARIAFNQNCGWVAPTNDPEVFAKMILDIARDKKTILEKKENAKNNFLNKYNWEVMEEKINKIYQNL